MSRAQRQLRTVLWSSRPAKLLTEYIIKISIYCYYSTIYEAVFVISFYNT